MRQIWETVWSFKTARFQVELQLTPSDDCRYDGDDETGEIQENINSGFYTMFDSRVVVLCNGREIGADYLGNSVYEKPQEFWTAHRDADPMNRNCSIMRAARGSNVCICHYFPDMVAQAIADARQRICGAPKLHSA